MTWLSIDDNPVLQNLTGDSPQPRKRTVRGHAMRCSGCWRDFRAGVSDAVDSALLGGMGYEEIAQIMIWSIPAVKSRLFASPPPPAGVAVIPLAMADDPAALWGTGSEDARGIERRACSLRRCWRRLRRTGL